MVVEWDGHKTTWVDDDLVDDDVWDTTVQEFIKLFVRYKHEDQFGVDKEKLRQLKFDRDEKLADLIHDCQVKNRLPEEEECEDERWPTTDELEDDEHDEDAVSYVIANIGDMQDVAPALNGKAVADLVKGWTPDFIVTNGDNQYSHVPDYETSTVGLYYAEDYVTDNIYTNKFWPAIGNLCIKNKNRRQHLHPVGDHCGKAISTKHLGNIRHRGLS